MGFPTIEYETIEPDVLRLDPKATPLDLLLAVIRNSRLPLHTRLRAAGIAAPFIHPKLSVVASVTTEDMALRLERAKARADAVRLIPVQPAVEPAQSFKRRF
jgi:hypothetical protein